MSLVPRVYKSTDAGAPALTGQAGSLTTLLDAVLVNGYGTGPSAKPGAGWTKQYSGTNKAVYRNSATTGTGRYLRMDDSSTYAGSNARYALARAYESMSGVDTGTGPAPTTSQVADGIRIPKSLSLDATARAWVIVANERWFYFFVDMGNTLSGWAGLASWPSFFGDLDSRKAGDAYQFVALAPSLIETTGLYANVTGGGLRAYPLTTALTAYAGGASEARQYILRNYAQASGAVAVGCCQLSDGDSSGLVGAGGSYPDPVTGGITLERIMVMEGVRQVRGLLPAVYASTNGAPYTDLETRTDFAGFASGTQILVKRVSQRLGVSTLGAADVASLFFNMTAEG